MTASGGSTPVNDLVSIVWAPRTFVPVCRFALVGGPARQDAPKAVDALKKLNVPYMVSLPLVFQTTEEWMASELGVHPVQVALQVSCSAFVSSISTLRYSFSYESM